MNAAVPTSPTLYHRWQRFSSAMVRGFHVYANWLVSISWKRFILLSLALLIGTAILQDLQPFTWRISEHVETDSPSRPARPAKPAKPAEPVISLDKPIHYEVTIDDR